MNLYIHELVGKQKGAIGIESWAKELARIKTTKQHHGQQQRG